MGKKDEVQQKLKARETVYRLLNFRLRSEKEILDKLRLKKFDNETIRETVRYFRDIRLLDDEQFAKSWIASRLKRPFGLNRIRRELKQKGIRPKIIEKQIDLIKDEYEEGDVVGRLARKRARTYNNVDPKKVKQRVYAYLIRRGFSTGACVKAVKKL